MKFGRVLPRLIKGRVVMTEKPLPHVLEGAKQIHIDPRRIGMRLVLGSVVLVMWLLFTGIVVLDPKEKNRLFFLSFFVLGIIWMLGFVFGIFGEHNGWALFIAGYVLLGAGLLILIQLKKY